MTRASEALPAEQPPPRAVVYLYSQTGQLREVADALTAPLVARGWDIRWVDVQPRVAFPFPWPIRRFFGVFPAAVDPEALVDLVEPAAGFETEPEELAILAYQVWFLAPSLPIRSLLKAHPEACPGSKGRLADRVPQHVVLGGDRGVRAVAGRGCSVRRGGRRDRHTAAGDYRS